MVSVHYHPAFTKREIVLETLPAFSVLPLSDGQNRC
jgi:hypothetical protein